MSDERILTSETREKIAADAEAKANAWGYRQIRRLLDHAAAMDERAAAAPTQSAITDAMTIRMRQMIHPIDLDKAPEFRAQWEEAGRILLAHYAAKLAGHGPKPEHIKSNADAE